MLAKTKAVILAAGLGTRLRPITDTTPKSLVLIDGKPLLDYWVDALIEVGVAEAIINTHYLRNIVEAYIASVNRNKNIKLVESHEEALLGSAGTIAANVGFADDAQDIFIIYSDNLSRIDLGQMLQVHRAHDLGFTMALFRSPNPAACGIAELDSDDRIVEFEEKPANPKSDLANAGIYLVNKETYQTIARQNAFDLAKDVIPTLTGHMKGYVFDAYHRDIGTLESLQQATHDVMSRRF